MLPKRRFNGCNYGIANLFGGMEFNLLPAIPPQPWACQELISQIRDVLVGSEGDAVPPAIPVNSMRSLSDRALPANARVPFDDPVCRAVARQPGVRVRGAIVQLGRALVIFVVRSVVSDRGTGQRLSRSVRTYCVLPAPARRHAPSALSAPNASFLSLFAFFVVFRSRSMGSGRVCVFCSSPMGLYASMFFLSSFRPPMGPTAWFHVVPRFRARGGDHSAAGQRPSAWGDWSLTGCLVRPEHRRQAAPVAPAASPCPENGPAPRICSACALSVPAAPAAPAAPSVRSLRKYRFYRPLR